MKTHHLIVLVLTFCSVFFGGVAPVLADTQPTSIAASPELFTSPNLSNDLSCSYVIVWGDTLSRIAARAGKNMWQLAAWNNIRNINLIYAGHTLSLCGGGSFSSPPGPAPITVSPPIGGNHSPREPCQSPIVWQASINQWTVPPSCYAGIYPVGNVYPAMGVTWGWCTWWAVVLHSNSNAVLSLPRHSAPRIGAIIAFAPGEQGASPEGHWGGEVIAFSGAWVLISEMNFDWRGGGFGKVNYRYVHLDPGVTFLY